MKKLLSFILAVWMGLSVCVLTCGAATGVPDADAAFAEARPGETVDLIVYDLLKLDVDAESNVCRAIVIFFQNQFCNYDASKEIVFLDDREQIAAVCKPRRDDNRKLDLYTPNGDYGVRLDPTALYYLVIPEGAYYTDDGILCSAYRGAYDGVNLTANYQRYDVRPLGIQEYFAVQYDETRLYAGGIRVATVFDTCKTGIISVILYRVDGKRLIEAGAFAITSFDRKKGAKIDFGGVEIDKYAPYILHVNFGTFTDGDKVVNAHTDYAVSGKKLLNLREDYPGIDMLIKLFGADHWTLKAVLAVMKALSTIKLIDKALYNDINKYISDRKKG